MEDRMTNVEQRLDKVETRVDHHEERLTKGEVSLGRIDEAATAVREDVRELVTEVKALPRRIMTAVVVITTTAAAVVGLIIELSIRF